MYGLAVDALQVNRRTPSAPHCVNQHADGRLRTLVVWLAPGEQRLAAAFDEECETAVVHHHGGAGLAPGQVADRTLWPRKSSTERVGRIGGRQHEDPVIWLTTDVVDRAARSELRCTKALDEVTATNASGVFHYRQYPVQRREAAGNLL
jgi:hypothetical protein